MQFYSNYLKAGEPGSNAFSRAFRETFLFQMINDVESQKPDNAKDDGQELYSVIHLTFEQKKRLRNQIFRDAKKLAENTGRSADDPDVLASAMADSAFGRKYSNYIRNNWLVPDKGARGRYEHVIKAWTLDSDRDFKAGKEISTVISPYDPLFADADVFAGNDNIAYCHCTNDADLTQDDEETDKKNKKDGIKTEVKPHDSRDFISTVYMGRRHQVMQGSLGDTDIMSPKPVPIENEVTSSGYHLVEHYIKSSDMKEKVKAALLKQYHAANDVPVSGSEAKYMSMALKYLSDYGFDFDIILDRDDKVCAKINNANDIEVRLLDRETPQYQGRIYDNGRPVYYGIQKNDSTLTYKDITHNDRLRMLYWYVGSEDVEMYVSENSITKFSNKYYIGQATPVPIKMSAGALGEEQRTVSIASSRSEHNSITAAIKSKSVPVKSRKGETIMVDCPINIQIHSSPVTSVESLPEDTFNSLLAMNDAYFGYKWDADGKRKRNVPDTVRLMDGILDNGRFSRAFRSQRYMSDDGSAGEVRHFGIFSDVNGDDWRPGSKVAPKYPEYADDLESYTDDAGKVHTVFKADVSEAHKNMYRAIVTRDELAAWVNDAENNFVSQVNLPDMIAKYKSNYVTDPEYVYEFSDDDTVANMQQYMWNILTGADGNMEISTEDGIVKTSDLSIADKERYLPDLLETNVTYDMFGTVPFLDYEHPGKFMDSEFEEINGVKPSGFYPENVIKFCQHKDSAGQQKNQSYITHMLSLMQKYGYADRDCHLVSGNSYMAGTIRKTLIQFDGSSSVNDIYPITLRYSDICIHNSSNVYLSPAEALKNNRSLGNEGTASLQALSSVPVQADMLFHTLKALSESGCEPDTISATIDRNGIIQYTGTANEHKFTKKRTREGGKYVLTDVKSKPIDIKGYIGQIFEPDEYGAIHTKYEVDNDKILIPGYDAYLTHEDPDSLASMSERLRLSGWRQQMKQAITREIHRSAFTLANDYNFVPHTASLNTVYKHMYDMAIDADDYDTMLAEKDPKQKQTNINIIRTLAGRCRFPNEYGEKASTMAQSYLEHPTESEAQKFDYYYSDLYDNKNIRVLSDDFDGIFDKDMTGTAKTAGLVRYLDEGVKVDSSTGKVTPVAKDAECPIMSDPLFKDRNLDTWDRRQMASSQILTALHTPRNIGAAMLNINGWNFDDGFIVTKKFAESNMIKDAVRIKDYEDMHNGSTPPRALMDTNDVISLFTGSMNDMYDEQNHVLRHAFVNDPYSPGKSLACPDTDTGDYPFWYDPHDSLTFEQQAAYAVQSGHGCNNMLRPLIAQDKLSDMHGNKGVISHVVDPAFMTSSLKQKGIVPEDMDAQGDNGERFYITDKPVLTGDGQPVMDYRGNAVTESVLNWHFISDPNNEGHGLRNPYRADGNYPMKYDPSLGTSFSDQAIYAVQKAFGMQDMDDVLKVFADNPDLDTIMAPYSGMGRFNGGTVHELMSSPEDIVINGRTVKGGMGHLNMIVVDMPADVKTHFYGPQQVAEGKGRKSSGQLSWILQAKHCDTISEMFYGNNQSAIDKMREYAISLGLDFDNKLRPCVGYTPMTIGCDKMHVETEKRNLIKLNDVASYFKDGAIPFKTDKDDNMSLGRKGNIKLDKKIVVNDKAETLAKLNEAGGFMELPFQLDFKTASLFGKSHSEESYMMPRTGQYYKLSDGKSYETFGMPVLPPNLRAGQEFVDSTTRNHEYTNAYLDIHRLALTYMVCQEQLLKETNDDMIAALKAQLKECQSAAQARFDTVAKDIFDSRFSDKHNLIRDNIMATKVNVSGTAVWSEDPRLNLDQIAMSTEHAKLLGIMDDAGTLLPKNDCRVLIWRDPILHDGGVRYLKVTIDDTLKGIAVNPLIDKSFDGDFDGDSVAVVPLIRGTKMKSNAKSSDAHQEAYNAFSIENNLLDIGTVIEDGPMKGMHPLYIQDGLDVKSNLFMDDPSLSAKEKARRKSLIDQYNDLTVRINETERLAQTNPELIKHQNASGREVTGSSALTLYRKEWLNDLNVWAHEALTGIATDHIIVNDKESVIRSLQNIAENGAKGNKDKMKQYADNLGIHYDVDADGNFIPGSTKWITGVDKGWKPGMPEDEASKHLVLSDTIPSMDRTVSRYTALGIQRMIDNAIQETAAYKADNTSLGGTQSQRGIAALRNQAAQAVTRLTYPTTQAILQSKHDPKDAKSKDFIVRYWGADVWNGYKLTGNFTGSAKEIQDSAHALIYDNVIDPATGMPKARQEKGEDGKWHDMVRENPDTGVSEIVYEKQPRKCTKEEWITQMLGMEKALKVDVNPEFIERIADIMEYSGSEPHKIYNVDNCQVYCSGRVREPITSNEKTIAGLATYAMEHGTLLDKMAYTDKAKALFNEAIKTEGKESIISEADDFAVKSMDYMQEMPDSSDRLAMKAWKEGKRAISAEKKPSAFFLPQKTKELMAGYAIRRVKAEDGSTVCRLLNPKIPGSSKCRVDLSSNPEATYMFESAREYEARVTSYKASLDIQDTAAVDTPVPPEKPVKVTETPFNSVPSPAGNVPSATVAPSAAPVDDNADVPKAPGQGRKAPVKAGKAETAESELKVKDIRTDKSDEAKDLK